MVASQLSLYNNSLYLLGEQGLATLTDSVETRRVMDSIWADNWIQNCLEDGYWTFAVRTSQLGTDTNIDTSAMGGYPYAFDKPTDYIKLVAMSLDAYFTRPWDLFDDEQAYWFTLVDTIYIKYISNSANFGLNYASWPQSFTNMAEAYGAMKACMRITQSETKQKEMDNLFQKARRDAQGKDAMNQPSKQMPLNSWARARMRYILTDVPSGIFSATGSLDY